MAAVTETLFERGCNLEDTDYAANCLTGQTIKSEKKIFDALDEIIRIIRKSDGKADAAEKIIKRFALDAEALDAVMSVLDELRIRRPAPVGVGRSGMLDR